MTERQKRVPETSTISLDEHRRLMSEQFLVGQGAFEEVRDRYTAQRDIVDRTREHLTVIVSYSFGRIRFFRGRGYKGCPEEIERLGEVKCREQIEFFEGQLAAARAIWNTVTPTLNLEPIDFDSYLEHCLEIGVKLDKAGLPGYTTREGDKQEPLIPLKR